MTVDGDVQLLLELERVFNRRFSHCAIHRSECAIVVRHAGWLAVPSVLRRRRRTIRWAGAGPVMCRARGGLGCATAVGHC